MLQFSDKRILFWKERKLDLNDDSEISLLLTKYALEPSSVSEFTLKS